ncbi:MAG TPA: hypothetical protein VN695_20740 [Streptosporangiaceae bacterium]|nr:hypothetical protein [Streptosporangiaceae bacterium]
MYQPYPKGGGQGPVEDRPPVPQSVLNAVKFMYAGAAVSLIEIIISLTTIGGLKSAIEKAYPKYTPAQVHTTELASITGLVISGLIGVGLWILMARLNLSGRSWARIVASVLFGINTLQLAATFTRPGTVLGTAFAVVLWVAGLGATVFLWRRESSGFFQPSGPR